MKYTFVWLNFISVVGIVNYTFINFSLMPGQAGMLRQNANMVIINKYSVRTTPKQKK